MAAPRNTWQVYDTTEPLLVWRLLIPVPTDAVDDAAARDAVDAALEALQHSGLVLGATQPLPTEDDVFAGAARPVQTRVLARTHLGALVERTSGDAGALLRELEGPTLDAAYARRFAAAGRPFVAVWSSRGHGTVEVCVAFFSTIAFDERDADVHAANHARVAAARAGLEQVARRRGGRLTAPLALTTR